MGAAASPLSRAAWRAKSRTNAMIALVAVGDVGVGRSMPFANAKGKCVQPCGLIGNVVCRLIVHDGFYPSAPLNACLADVQRPSGSFKESCQ